MSRQFRELQTEASNALARKDAAARRSNVDGLVQVDSFADRPVPRLLAVSAAPHVNAFTPPLSLLQPFVVCPGLVLCRAVQTDASNALGRKDKPAAVERS